MLCVGADGCVVGAAGGHVLNFKNEDWTGLRGLKKATEDGSKAA